MGAPKQKWTQEEEAALKAGVIKHGAGKWRTILKDPEFSGVLYLRSNVDLKLWFFGHNLLDRVYSKGESVDFCHFIFFSSFHHEKLKQKVYDELYSSA
jgi:hypothetical protein